MASMTASRSWKVELASISTADDDEFIHSVELARRRLDDGHNGNFLGHLVFYREDGSQDVSAMAVGLGFTVSYMYEVPSNLLLFVMLMTYRRSAKIPMFSVGAMVARKLEPFYGGVTPNPKFTYQ